MHACSQPERVLHQRLRPTIETLRSAREAARAALADVAPEAVVEDVVIIVSELVTNSVRHGGLAPDDRIVLTVRAGDTIRVEVEDPGVGFDGSLPEERDPVDGGQGLRIVQKLSARWGARIGPQTLVWAHVPRSP